MTEKEQDDSIEIDDSLIKLLPQMIANSVGIAKYYRSFYERLVAEGFSKEQALRILIARGMNL